MSDLGNKEVFAENLKYYIDKSGKDRRELAEEWGFPYSTVTEWINAKKYPRIDRIEIMANYFHILKSDLVERKDEQNERRKIMQKNNDIRTDIVMRMRTDSDFLFLVESLYNRNDSEIIDLMKTLLALDKDQISGVKQMLNAFLK